MGCGVVVNPEAKGGTDFRFSCPLLNQLFKYSYNIVRMTYHGLHDTRQEDRITSYICKYLYLYIYIGEQETSLPQGKVLRDHHPLIN